MSSIPPAEARQERFLADVVSLELRAPTTVVLDEKQHAGLQPGCAILFQGRKAGAILSGWVWRMSTRRMIAGGTKMLGVNDAAPTLDPQLIDLAIWIAEYDRVPINVALKLLQPPRWPPPKARGGKISPLAAPQQGALSSTQPLSREAAPSAFEAAPSAIENATVLGNALSDASRLKESDPQCVAANKFDFQLTKDQENAIRAGTALLEKRQFASLLVWGVTGSGKTEVYVRLAQQALVQGRGVLVLVPEIAIATQAIARFSERFPGCSIWHSGIAEGEKSRTWQRLSAGEVRMVIGTRSAAMLPIANLGLIVVDEEQETSFKNLATPRYHARNVALVRGQRTGSVVVLTSATPCLETIYNAEIRPEANQVALLGRATGVALPKVEIVDRTLLPLEERNLLFTSPLVTELQKTLDAGRQAILLLNRRGWAGQIQCPACGFRLTCPSCSLPLVAHEVNFIRAPTGSAGSQKALSDASRPTMAPSKALCHHCSYQEDLPSACPRCSEPLQLGRYGVDYAVDQLRRMYPAFRERILQFDADQVSKHADYERILTEFSEEKYSVLIGTQMVAKGLDFPSVRLVAILDADQRLNLPDFRAGERTAQLLVQVAGRAGRASEQGLVLIQTAQPNHPAIQAAVTGDYAAFARAELRLRKENHWPPYTRLARAVLQDESLTKLWQSAHEWRKACLDALGPHGLNLEILPPQPPLVPRRRNQYRLQVLWRCPHVNDLLHALDLLPGFKLSRPRTAGFHWDIDPVAFD